MENYVETTRHVFCVGRCCHTADMDMALLALFWGTKVALGLQLQEIPNVTGDFPARAQVACRFV